MSARPPRFETLDGLRGVAALAVLAFHCGLKLDAPWIMPHGWLAVDLFFVLSGFVIAQAYGERLRAGMSALAFARVRLRRLYPTYLIGVVVGLAAFLLAWRLGRSEIPLAAALLFSAMGALLVPIWVGSTAAFPIDPPGWSLLVEALANVAYALGLRCAGPRTLSLIAAAFALALVAAACVGPAPDGGSRATLLWIGLLRGGYSFTVGLMLHRLHQDGRLSRLQCTPGLLLVGTAALLAIGHSRWDKGYELGFILLASPLVVAAATQCRPSPRLGRVCVAWAALSYPLYCLHAPLLDLAARLAPAEHSRERLLGVILSAAVSLLAAWLLRSPRRAPPHKPAAAYPKLNSGTVASL